MAYAGATLRVKPGQMRNYWYPQGIARYITGEELRDVKRKPDLVEERDPFFGRELPKTDLPAVAEEVINIETELLPVGVRPAVNYRHC